MQILNRRFQIDKVRRVARVLAAWIAVSGVAGIFAQSREASEYQIKAAFLYNFTKFVEWSSEASPGENDPLVICIVGENPFGDNLNSFIKDKTINGHKLVVRQLEPAQDLKGCQIAFISSAARNQLRSIFQNANHAGVLTVGETEGFAAQGGVIDFIREEKKVHFEINVDAAQRTKLKISSKLISLARIVKEQDQGRKN